MDGYVCRIKFTFEAFSKNLKVQRGNFRAGASRMDASALNLSIVLVMKSTAPIRRAKWSVSGHSCSAQTPPSDGSQSLQSTNLMKFKLDINPSFYDWWPLLSSAVSSITQISTPVHHQNRNQTERKVTYNLTLLSSLWSWWCHLYPVAIINYSFH